MLGHEVLSISAYKQLKNVCALKDQQYYIFYTNQQQEEVHFKQ